MSSFNSIAADKLWRLIGVPHGPVLIDVRGKTPSPRTRAVIPGAIRRPLETVSSWAREFAGRSAVAICETGRGESEGVAAWLREQRRLVCRGSCRRPCGLGASWPSARPQGKLPPRDPQGRTVWVTRSRPKIDRIACPWLIRRFVDPTAVFLFVAPAEVLAVAERSTALRSMSRAFLGHRGERCTFDTITR